MKEKLFRILFVIILLTGLVLRFYQYLMGRSLWEDEAHMALNFISYGYADLMKPLDYIQAAPVLFIIITEFFTQVFGFTEHAFRAFPFITSVLTFPLFYFIILELTKNKITALIGFFIFSVNLAAIYFSSELKVYAVDLSAYLLMIYFSVSNHTFVQKYRTWLLALAGSISLLSSTISFVVLFCIACNMFLNWYQDKKIRKSDLKILSAWACVFIVNYFLFIHDHPHAAIQKLNYTFAFLPTDPLSCDFVNFIRKTIDETFFTLLLYISKAYGFAYVLLLIFIVAIRYLLKNKKYTLLIFTCLPILLHLLMSALKIYPFYYRLILYLVPPLMILMAIGTYVIADFIVRKVHFIAGAIFVIGCCYFFTEISIKNYPLWFREVKPSLDYMNKNYPDKKIYVTTSYTLYKYYHLTGYAKDSLYTPLEWNITPEKYEESVQGEKENYILFHTEDPSVDGYGSVIEDLKKKNLIVKQFSYKYYTVSEVKPANADTNLIVINYNDFDPGNTFDLNGEKVIAIWATDVTTKPLLLSRGKYSLGIVAKGTPVSSVYPHIKIMINDRMIGDFSTTENYRQQNFSFELETDEKAVIKIIMDNDEASADQKEDRNTFVKGIYIKAISH
jgi:hypothetical protein